MSNNNFPTNTDKIINFFKKNSERYGFDTILKKFEFIDKKLNDLGVNQTVKNRVVREIVNGSGTIALDQMHDFFSAKEIDILLTNNGRTPTEFIINALSELKHLKVDENLKVNEYFKRAKLSRILGVDLIYTNPVEKKEYSRLYDALEKIGISLDKEERELLGGYLSNLKNKLSTKFKNYVEYASAYINDFTKKFGSDVNSENIAAFKKSWIGKRMITVASMFFITGILMSQIPKLYTKASGHVNPNASAIYDEAKKTDRGDK